MLNDTYLMVIKTKYRTEHKTAIVRLRFNYKYCRWCFFYIKSHLYFLIHTEEKIIVFFLGIQWEHLFIKTFPFYHFPPLKNCLYAFFNSIRSTTSFTCCQNCFIHCFKIFMVVWANFQIISEMTICSVNRSVGLQFLALPKLHLF